KRAYCLKTQPATGETYPKSDLFNKAMNTNKTLGSNKQHSDRECLYKAEVTMTGKGTRFQEWMPVFFTVNILALVIPGYLQKSSITMTERG
ncbi:hypothetical protein, partial [Escherichia coli]|uniref:hypothetical protein n=1 Tax=Escherichia coli TaxID=562 RepID=UPI001958D239